jgi:large repetitive protein
VNIRIKRVAAFVAGAAVLAGLVALPSAAFALTNDFAWTAGTPDGVQNVSVGTPYSAEIHADYIGQAQPAPSFHYAVASFPSWLHFDADTHVISGTPTVATADVVVLIEVSNSSPTGANLDRNITFHFTDYVAPVPTLTWTNQALPGIDQLQVGQSYGPTAVAADLANGTGTVTYSSTDLPPGLTLDESTGAVAGTPTDAGVFPFSITASAADASSITADFAASVNPAPVAPRLVWSDDTLDGLNALYVGQAYRDGVTAQLASGSPASVRYSLGDTTLPDGLTLDASTGEVSGTPTAAVGQFSFAITASLVQVNIMRVQQSAPVAITKTFTGSVLDPSASLQLAATEGTATGTGSAQLDAAGLQPGSTYTLTLHSTPRQLASGTVGATGTLSRLVVLPSDIESGAHTLTLTGTGINGAALTSSVWFSVANGVFVKISTTGPVPEPAVATSARLASTGVDANAPFMLALTLIGFGGLVIATRLRRRAPGSITR